MLLVRVKVQRRTHVSRANTECGTVTMGLANWRQLLDTYAESSAVCFQRMVRFLCYFSRVAAMCGQRLLPTACEGPLRPCPCLNGVVALCCRLLACPRCLCYRLYLGGGLGVCGDSPALHLSLTASPAASGFPGCYRLVNRPTAVARLPGSASSSEAGGLGASGPLFVKAPLQTCVLHAAGSGFQTC